MRGTGRAGFTLIEVMIGMLLIALMVGPLFSVALTARQSKPRVEQKTAAAVAGSRLLERLKLYVTADTSAVPGPAPGTSPNGWGLPGDSCNCYALAPGTHQLNASAWLPELAGLGGSIRYTVTPLMVGSGVTQSNVNVTIDWGTATAGAKSGPTLGAGVGVGAGAYQ